MGHKEIEERANVLVIAYYFPPCGGGGVQRIAKFVKYLPEFGWVPTVLTVSASYYGRNRDESHTAEFGIGTEIIRTPKRLSTDADQIEPNKGPSLAVKFMHKLHSTERRIQRKWDEMGRSNGAFWFVRGLVAGLRAHRRRRFDLIYATGEPYSDFLIALVLSRLTGVPFVIDMRDPWTLHPYQVPAGSTLRRFAERWAERRVLAACVACVFANRAIDAYATTFPQWQSKFHLVPNGYDSADLDDVQPRQFTKFTMVHNGNFLQGYRTADTFLIALRNLLAAQPEWRERLQVLFVGRIRMEEKLIRDLGLGDVVVQKGYLPHRESIEYIKGADLLLLIGGSQIWEESAKVYEYLASGKPILALVRPDGAAAELLRQYLPARIVDREDVAATTAALQEITSEGSDFGGSINVERASWVRQYDRRLLTEKLARLLDSLSRPPVGKD